MLRHVLLAALLCACAATEPGELAGPATPPRATSPTPPVARGADGPAVAPLTSAAASRIAPSAFAATPSACVELPELADARNELPSGRGYELAGLTLSADRFRGGCAGSDATGADVAVRFTPPTPGVWRLTFSQVNAASRGYNPFSVSVHGRCVEGAPGAVRRCLQSDGPLALALSEPVTVVVDGCRYEAPCRVNVRVERVDPSPAAPRLAEVHLYRVGGGLAVAGRARDDDGDLRVVLVELLDARGRTLPQPNGAPRGEFPFRDVGERDSFRFPLWNAPPEVARVRVSVEDATARSSAAVEVPVEDPAPLAPGASCDPAGYPGTCGLAARCIYSRATGYVCVPRLAAFYDADAGALRVDFDPRELGDAATARIALLDAAGAALSLEGPVSIPAPSPYRDERFPVLAYDRWRAPAGTARVRAEVFSRTGGLLATFEAAVRAPEVRGAFYPCDPATTARERCDVGLVCGDVRYSSAMFRCSEPVVACPGDMNARAWAPDASAERSVIEGGMTGWFVARVSCQPVSASNWGGAVDFVAPRGGTWRFTLTAPGAPERSGFALSLRRYCGLGGTASERACVAADGAPARAASLTVTAAAGEHVPLIVSAPGPSLSYRLEAAREDGPRSP